MKSPESNTEEWLPGGKERGTLTRIGEVDEDERSWLELEHKELQGTDEGTEKEEEDWEDTEEVVIVFVKGGEVGELEIREEEDNEICFEWLFE